MIYRIMTFLCALKATTIDSMCHITVLSVYTGAYKDLKPLQKRKEKELELEDDQGSVVDDETKGELVCVTCNLNG